MRYENKVLVLKETAEGFSTGNPVGGILRLETEDGVSAVFLSMINVSALKSGSYVLFLTDGNGFSYEVDLGKKPTSFRTRIEREIATENVCAGVYHLADGIPVTVAFSSSESKKMSLTDFKKAVADRFYREFKEKKKNEETFDAYNDEAVATENYYDFAEKKETFTAENNYERFNAENGADARGEQVKTEKEEAFAFRTYDETDTDTGKKERYFSKISAELEATFKKHPHERVLENIFRGSRWVKINYTESRYYVVGIIYENSKEKYVCYGVPDKFSEYAPKELEGYCSFIPLSVFDLSGNGYWMMFQDAETGACLKKN